MAVAKSGPMSLNHVLTPNSTNWYYIIVPTGTCYLSLRYKSDLLRTIALGGLCGLGRECYDVFVSCVVGVWR